MSEQLELDLPWPYTFSPRRPFVTDPTPFARHDCATCGGSGWHPTEVPEWKWCMCAVIAEREAAGPCVVEVPNGRD